jgi:hypothetical protein
MTEIVRVVEDNSLRVTETGCEIRLRLKWYRSLPLSSIERLQLALDGQPVDPGSIRLGVNGHQYQLEQLADLVEEFWFVQDSAILSVSQRDKLKPGESHKIDVELALRFPYIPIGPGKFLTRVNRYTDTQIAQ